MLWFISNIIYTKISPIDWQLQPPWSYLCLLLLWQFIWYNSLNNMPRVYGHYIRCLYPTHYNTASKNAMYSIALFIHFSIWIPVCILFKALIELIWRYTVNTKALRKGYFIYNNLEVRNKKKKKEQIVNARHCKNMSDEMIAFKRNRQRGGLLSKFKITTSI